MIQNPTDVSFSRDEGLEDVLMNLFHRGTKTRPEVIIETGTYHGTGTTQVIINAVEKAKLVVLPKFYTIEVSEKNVERAKENLSPFFWVEIIHGLSVDRQKAIDFIKEDDAIINHQKYPELYIDAEDPIPFYLKEVDGQLFGEGSIGRSNILSDLIKKHRLDRPLFALDSAGGIGLLEFSEIVDLMGRNRYYVLLFDTYHLKHFRSVEYIKDDPKTWDILGEEEKFWFLAYHKK